jgi:hypothetical protein
MDVLKTTSPSAVPFAPKDWPFHTEPSSRTSLQSDVFHGFCAAAAETAGGGRGGRDGGRE